MNDCVLDGGLRRDRRALGRLGQQSRLSPGKISATLNGASIYVVAKRSAAPDRAAIYFAAKRRPEWIRDERGAPMFEDIAHFPAPSRPPAIRRCSRPASWPPRRTSRRRGSASAGSTLASSSAAGSGPEATTSGRERDPMWERVDPPLRPFRTVARASRMFGYAGPPDARAGEVYAKHIVTDMYARAVQGGARRRRALGGAPARADLRARAVELPHEPWQARIVEAGRARLVEARAVEEPPVALPDPRADRVVAAGDRIGVDHLVGNQVGHARPVALDGLAVQVRDQILPAVGGQDGLVGAGGRVEGDLLSYRPAALLELLRGVADHDEGGARECEVGPGTAGGLEALRHGGVHVLAQVGRAVERVHVEAVAHLAGDPAEVPVHSRDEDRDPRVGNRAGVEEGRHQVEAIEPALEVEPGSVLPGVPDRAEGLHDLAELRPRRLELHREAALVVPLHLGSEAEDETPPRGLLQIPREVGEHHRAPREGDRDRGAELDRGGRGR